MDFSNALPGDNTFSDDKATSQAPIYTPCTLPAYPDANDETSAPCNVYWTPAKCGRYDYVLHIFSLLFGLCTLALYTFDLAKSQSYHVKLPVGLTVVDAMSISFLCVNNAWSILYIFFSNDIGVRTAKGGQMTRKWQSVVDLILHTCLVGIADTTLSMRTARKNCEANRAVGGCVASRRGVMIAAGVMMILTALGAQFRFAVTCHAARERKRIAKKRARQLAQDSTDPVDSNVIRWSNRLS